MIKQKRSPIAPDPSKDPSIEISEGHWLGAVAMGLVYLAIVALFLIICIRS